MPLTKRELSMMRGVARAIARAANPLQAEISALRKQVAELEARGIQYLGVYQRSSDYKRGDIVSHHGSAWHCVQLTSEEPGASKHWQLMAGRDA